MNRYAAPCQSDVNHHRNHFEPSKLAALRLLDRVADGQAVSERDVQLALEVTGDVHRDAFADMAFREFARNRANRGSAAVAAAWQEGPCSPREQHPSAGGKPA